MQYMCTYERTGVYVCVQVQSCIKKPKEKSNCNAKKDDPYMTMTVDKKIKLRATAQEARRSYGA